MAQTRRVRDNKRDSLAAYREVFARLFADCHGGRLNAQSFDLFLDTLRVCEHDGARLDAVHAALRKAFEHKLADDFYTRTIRPQHRQFVRRARAVRRKVETALHAAIRLHESVDPHQYAPELCTPYRDALAYLVDRDLVLRGAGVRGDKGGNPNQHWVRSLTYPALAAAGVATAHHKDLLRQLALIR